MFKPRAVLRANLSSKSKIKEAFDAQTIGGEERDEGVENKKQKVELLRDSCEPVNDSSGAINEATKTVALDGEERERLLREKLLKQKILKKLQISSSSNIVPNKSTRDSVPCIHENNQNRSPAIENDANNVKEEVEELGKGINSSHLIISVGSLIANRYRVTSVLGKGVFSTVFRCTDTVSSSSSDEPCFKDVAVKVIYSASYCIYPLSIILIALCVFVKGASGGTRMPCRTRSIALII